jgi:hypothetical protein
MLFILAARPPGPSSFAKGYGGQVGGRDSLKELPASTWSAGGAPQNSVSQMSAEEMN